MIKLLGYYYQFIKPQSPTRILFSILAIGMIAGCGTEDTPEVVVNPTPVPTSEKQEEPAGMDTAYFARRMADLSELSRAHLDERTILFSSHNFDPGPDDSDKFIGNDYKMDGEDWRVMLDDKGPGCISRIWLSNNFNGRLRFFFDDEPKPRLDMTVNELLEGKYKKIATMLIFSVTETNTGQVFYVPIPYKKQCTIMTSATNPGLKYQINVRKFVSDADVITFDPNFDERTTKALEEASKLIGTMGIGRFLNENLREQTITIPPKQEGLSPPTMILNLPGPAAIDYLHFNFKILTPEIMQNLHLQVFWDNLSEPSIDCTLADFFCSIGLEQNWNSLPMGYLKDGDNHFLYSQFYMPFEEKTQFYMVNNNNEPIQFTLKYHIDLTKIPEKPLNLFIRSNTRQFYLGWLYNFMEFEGVGNFVGINLSAASEEIDPKFFYMEGDEFFYVNGEKNAVWNGTGMDNYFNCDEKIPTPYFWIPTHGCIRRLDIEGGASNCLRFHLLDSIPFQTSLMLVQEIGCPIKYTNILSDRAVKANYKWTCFWYGKLAKQKVPRQEDLQYFTVTQNENNRPTEASPIMRGTQIYLKLPVGNYWIHHAPVWDLNQVQHQKQVVE